MKIGFWKNIVKIGIIGGFLLAFNIGTASASNEVSPYLNEVVITLPSLPITYLPMDMVDRYTGNVIKYVFEPLFFDNGEEFTSDVFEKWSLAKNNLEYNFTVKNGLKFHNNTEITASDVIFTLEASRKAHQGAISYVKNIVEIKQLSKYNFTITLSKPCSYLIAALADPTESIVPANYGGLSAEAFAKKPVGSGKYKLVSVTPDEVIIERVAETPGVKKIKYLKATASEAVKLFKEGKVTEPNEIIFSEAGLLTKEGLSGNYIKEELPLLETQIIGFNFKQKILQDKDVRGFLFNLFRDPAYNSIVTSGTETILAGGFIPQGMRGFEARDNDYEATRLKELQKAYINLLKKHKSIALELKTRFTKEQLEKINVWLKGALQAFSKVVLKVSTHTNEELFGSVTKGNFDMFAVSWTADFTHPLFFTAVFLSESNTNFFGLKDKTFDKFFVEYESANKPQDIAFFQKINNYLNNNYFVIPISYIKKTYFFPNNISGYKLNLMGPAKTDLSQVKQVISPK